MNLREARRFTGKKQREIAEAIGVSIPQISRLENGIQTGITLRQRQLIEKFLNVDNIEWNNWRKRMQNDTIINLSEKLMKVKEVAQRLGCSTIHVYKMAERGQLHCVRWYAPNSGLRRKPTVRFKPKDVAAFIEEHSN